MKNEDGLGMRTHFKEDFLRLKPTDYFFPLLIVAIFSYISRGYQLDDALIYLRYIKNYQDGFGLVYNPGEKFNGLTSPLFTYLMVAGSLFTKDLLMLSLVLFGVFFSWHLAWVDYCYLVRGSASFWRQSWWLDWVISIPQSEWRHHYFFRSWQSLPYSINTNLTSSSSPWLLLW